MATDSRLTRTKAGKPVSLSLQKGEGSSITSVKQTTYTLSDYAQKVFLFKKNGIGISFCGNAMIGGAVASDYLQNFEIERISSADTAKEVAHKLASCGEAINTHFFVCGYHKAIPYAYDVHHKKVTRLNAVRTSDKGSRIKYGATWSGQKEAINKIMKGVSPLQVDWNLMPLRDAIDLAEFLVDATIKYERFGDHIQTCGGDIDILVMTKDQAFWKQHKVYIPKI